MLFVDKTYHKRGIAKQLFDEFVKDVKSSSDKATLTVNSSPYAVGFYHKMGFKDTDNELEKDGIRFVPMELSI
jgi:predicted GNAT family N-acyltransferase